jgi:hypothetical protein
LYAEGKQDIEAVKRQWKSLEKKMGASVSSLTFWDKVAGFCLSIHVEKVSRGQLALENCLEIKRNFERRGLRISPLRHIKWFVRYRVII